MKKQLTFGFALMAVAFSWGCNNEIFVKDRDFRQLCENSGGKFQDATCYCGANWKATGIVNKGLGDSACMYGVVCVNNGEKCANDSKVCDQHNLGVIRCNNDVEKIGRIEICQQSETDEYPIFALYKGENLKDKFEAGDDATCYYDKERFEGEHVSCLEINNRSDKCGECKNGEIKCDDITGVPRTYVCENGMWNKDKGDECLDGNSCNADKTKCGECRDGNTKCNDDRLSTCANGVWGEAVPCPEDKSCNADGTKCGECKNDAKKCKDSTRSVCVNGAWLDIECPIYNSCTEDYLCGECSRDEQRCVPPDSSDGNAVIQKCVNGKWKTEPEVTCTVATCDTTGKMCGICHKAETICIDDPQFKSGVYYECKENSWVTAICPDGLSCEKDPKTNADNEILKDEEGNVIYESKVCGECVNDATECVTLGSGDDERSLVLKCSGGKWASDEDKTNILSDINSSEDNKSENEHFKEVCINSCDADGKACGECKNDDTKCEDGTLSICVSGAWSEVACPEGHSCTPSATSEGFECGECKNNATKCTDGQKQTCSNGKWGTAAKCVIDLDDGKKDVSCNATGTDCGVCNNTDTQCSDGILSTCSNGEWSKESCPNAYSCNAQKTECGKCRNDDQRCFMEDGKPIIQKCENGAWIHAYDCPQDSKLCDSTEKVCGTCGSGEQSCYNNHEKRGVAYYCVDGKWSSVACGEASCDKDDKCGDCLDGDTECVEENNIGKFWRCDKGKWPASKIACPENVSCNGKSCGECKTGDVKCENGIRSECVNGAWANYVACPNSNSCSDETNCGECKNGELECYNGNLRKCENGTFQDDSPCTNGCMMVGNSAQCKECSNDEPICENGILRICTEGKLTLVGCASNTCDASMTACGPSIIPCSVQEVLRCEENEEDQGYLYYQYSRCINGSTYTRPAKCKCDPRDLSKCGCANRYKCEFGNPL